MLVNSHSADGIILSEIQQEKPVNLVISQEDDDDINDDGEDGGDDDRKGYLQNRKMLITV